MSVMDAHQSEMTCEDTTTMLVIVVHLGSLFRGGAHA
jgi:hypothetical protein